MMVLVFADVFAYMVRCTQPIGGLVRYMTTAHRRDLLEAFFDSVCADKFRTMVTILEKKYKATCKLIGGCVGSVRMH